MFVPRNMTILNEIRLVSCDTIDLTFLLVIIIHVYPQEGANVTGLTFISRQA